MLRPATARLLTVTPVENNAPNWLPHPTGQVPLGLAIVESPASHTVGAAARAARADDGEAAQAVPLGAETTPTTCIGTSNATAASQRNMPSPMEGAAGRRPRVVRQPVIHVNESERQALTQAPRRAVDGQRGAERITGWRPVRRTSRPGGPTAPRTGRSAGSSAETACGRPAPWRAPRTGRCPGPRNRPR